MALNALSGPSRRWNAWTALLTLALLASNFWIPVSNAAALAPRDDPIANNLDLRVLPIGDSITFGAESTGDNGYRKRLYKLLTDRGNSVNFVGNSTDGDFADTNHEGHRKKVISEIAEESLYGIYAAPNIVLLHAGTNDMKNGIDVTNAPSRLKSLINLIFKKAPNAVVLVCQIIPADPGRFPNTVPRIEAFNEAIPDLVESFVDRDKKVLMVSMNTAVSTSQLADGLHPNDIGYDHMADEYYAAIQKADEKGWITKAGEGSIPPTQTNSDKCLATPYWLNVGQIADGPKAAGTDGAFEPVFAERGVIADGDCKRGQLHFMDLDGDGKKDYACVDPDTGETKVKIRKSSTEWEDKVTVAAGAKGRKGSGVMFADLNGDGRDDYIYIDSRNGAISAWINRGKGDPDWLWQGLGVIASGVGATTKNVQMADLNGDGRADLFIVSPTTGAVTAWLNTGADIIPDYHKLGVIASGASETSGDKVVLGDFTGEGRADYMIIGEGGKVTGLINRLQEMTLEPRWLPAVTIADGPDGVDQDEVRMVDMTGNGKVDYLSVSSSGKVSLWENLSTGGKYQIGEGVFLCDLDGDGTSDYFWVDHKGRGWGYLNTGKGIDQWYGLGQIAKGGYDREQIRMGVLTKSHRADYIVIDEETGAAEWWQNLGKDWNYEWASRGIAAAGPYKTIRDKFGWKFRGKNVRFADLDGDGLDDYLYVNEQGAVVYWKNLGTASETGTPSWGLPHLVADGVGVLPQDVQFADTDGDGFLDYVVVGRVTGMSRTWHNLGIQGSGDDVSIRWNTPMSFADGTGSAGFAIKITEMTGDKRADYVSIDPDNGRINLWKNRCWEIDEGDDGGDGGDGGGSGNDKPWIGRTETDWCHLEKKSGFVLSEKSYIWGSSGDGLGVGEWLDEWLAAKKEKDWVNNLRDLYEGVISNSSFSTLSCNDIYDHSSCEISDLTSCKNFYDADIAPVYWVLRAVANVNRVVGETAEALTAATIEAMMDEDRIVKEFEEGDRDTKALQILTTALSAAGAFSAGSAPASGTFGGLSSFVTLMSQLSPADENKDDLLADGAMKMLYSTTRRGLRALLFLVVEGQYEETSFNHADEDEIKEPKKLKASDLPNLGDTSYQTSIAKFFREGRWLIDNDKLASDMTHWEGNFQDISRQAIITALLRDQRWFVFIDEELNTEALCSRTEGSNNDGRRWIDGWCYDIFVWKYVNQPLYSLDANSADSWADEKFQAMQKSENGGVEMADIYKNAVDCALKYPDGDGAANVANLDIAGRYPVCFFSFPVVRGRRTKRDIPDHRDWMIRPPQSEPYINSSNRGQTMWTDEET
ncbi:Fc.00g056840.m01.CDS01 [Cosmosporella sp. VM-42]